MKKILYKLAITFLLILLVMPTVKATETTTPNEKDEENSENTNQEEKDDDVSENQKIKIYTARVITTIGLNVRKEANTNSEIVGFLNYNDTFQYRDADIKELNDPNASCQVWIYVGSKNGYACKDYTEVVSTEKIDTGVSNMTDEEFDDYLNKEGFDETYKVKLKAIHKKYPNWIFKGVKTNRNWQSTVKQESEIGYSTYYMDAIRESAGQEAYLNTESYYDWNTNMFYGYDGTFYLANEQTVAYFLDPRNYLNESNIFMFETLYFNDTYQDKDKIKSILGTDEYSDLIYNNGKKYNYSPIALAIKIRQEGTLNRRPTLGNVSVNCTGTNSPYYNPNGTRYNAPLYNFFNIGATSSPSNADLNGLCYAALTNEDYFLPWNTKARAIEGGTKWIYNNYVASLQYTNYFQKFNTANPNTEIWHQYMTNIEDPKSQSSILYNLYSNIGLLNSSFIFYIPIYDQMPEKTELPKLGNPNNWLKTLTYTANNTTYNISNFNGNVTDYTVTVPHYTENITINGTTVAKTSYLAIEGSNNSLKTASKQVTLSDEENKFKIVVTAGNGNTKTYTLTVIKDKEVNPMEQPTIEEMLDQAQLTLNETYVNGITFGKNTNALTDDLLKINKYAIIKITNDKDEVKNNGILGTGDRLTITSNNETKTFEILLFGDINGDGNITNLDLLRVQRHLWNDIELKEVYFKAADVNKDGTITNLDLLRIQRHLWNDIVISQN